jgi:hypothetical protein
MLEDVVDDEVVVEEGEVVGGVEAEDCWVEGVTGAAEAGVELVMTGAELVAGAKHLLALTLNCKHYSELTVRLWCGRGLCASRSSSQDRIWYRWLKRAAKRMWRAFPSPDVQTWSVYWFWPCIDVICK